MFDLPLRTGLKEPLFAPLARRLPPSIQPNQLTILAFAVGLSSCAAASIGHFSLALTLWSLNRALDCLDGAVARCRNCSTELGGFLDILGDFIIYSLLPVAIALGNGATDRDSWLAIALLEASFHINNVVLFYAAAVAAKVEANGSEKEQKVTSVVMRPALIEGFEAGVLFTAMLILPRWLNILVQGMAVGVLIGTVQRVHWLLPALGKLGRTSATDKEAKSS
jgi:phosphatidylglycerophosphate synthase